MTSCEKVNTHGVNKEIGTTGITFLNKREREGGREGGREGRREGGKEGGREVIL